MASPTKDEVSLRIGGKEWKFWSEISITRALDTFSTVQLSAPFEPDRRAFRDAFRPFDFVPLEVKIGGSTYFNGVKVGIEPKSDEQSSTVDVSGYALPGVLNDCSAPEIALPLEFSNLGLKAIAEAVAKPFGIEVEFQGDAGPVFQKEALEVDQGIFDFIAGLAKQRNLIVSNTLDGKLLCWRSVSPGNPRAKLEGQPLSSVSATFSPQSYYSEITGYSPTRRKREGGRKTEKNPFLEAVLRPHAFKAEDSEDADLPAAVRAKLGRMFGNMAAFAIENLPTWRDPKGRLWEPNTTVTVKHPEAMIYQETEMLIRSVTFVEKAGEQTSALELVLPGSFSGELPDKLPWGEPLVGL